MNNASIQSTSNPVTVSDTQKMAENKDRAWWERVLFFPFYEGTEKNNEKSFDMSDGSMHIDVKREETKQGFGLIALILIGFFVLKG